MTRPLGDVAYEIYRQALPYTSSMPVWLDLPEETRAAWRAAAAAVLAYPEHPEEAPAEDEREWCTVYGYDSPADHVCTVGVCFSPFRDGGTPSAEDAASDTEEECPSCGNTGLGLCC